ncbi:substrate-binding domain-containing protein [Streptomyces sp. CL12-4]|uniref:GntR family transcriptional regulator n=1 Tax=Streptomyces sp. CL12-4 TaxID=2810306 RepID=UPI001EFC1F10|nr:GntR family transcriptional regulator [Streptomyces sp. CL12-4]MCG8970288.1 GntR family transcriptional regulator [Streptomyces sp. CL12-4]
MAEHVQPSADRTAEGTVDLKFRQLARELRERIRQGTWPADSRLPTEKQLAESSRTSVSTVRRAVDELVAEGLVVRRQGSGTFVLPPDAPGPNRALVGVVVPDTAFYYPRVLQGIEETLSAAGARLLLACSGYDQERESKDLQDMFDAGVDGLLVVPTLTGPEAAEHYLARLAALPVPAVLVERRGTSLGDTNEYVCTHHEAGAYDAVRHLAALGHRAIGLALRDPSPTAAPVAEGFRQATAELDCTTTEFRATREEWSPATADRCLAALRAAGVSAVVCFGDRQAAMLVGAARRAGLTVPGDLALVAYDDEIADLADISLTAVAPPKHLLGITAAETLLRRLDNPALPRRRVLLRPGITVRQSCGAA